MGQKSAVQLMVNQSQTQSIREVGVDSSQILDEFVFKYGYQPDSYLATAPGRESFWSKRSAGLVSYKRVGRHILVSGGLITQQEERGALLQEFLEYTKTHGFRPGFFVIEEEDVHLFREAGFAVNKIGESASLSLPTLTFAGKQYEWVRRQVSYCQRQGVIFQEVQPFDYSRAEWEELLAELHSVTRDTMKGKPQTDELSFFDGTLNGHPLGYRRLFVAKVVRPDGVRTEGYVVCNPIHGGRIWATEIYRHRADAVRGTIPFLLHQIAMQLKAEGVERMNLCPVLGRNCQEPIPGEKPAFRIAMALFLKYGTFLWDLHGLDHFKSRFRPEYSNVYVCSLPGISLGAITAAINAIGILKVCPKKTLMLMLSRFRRRRTHQPSND